MVRRVPPPGWSQLSHPRESEGDGSGQQVLSGGMPPIVSKGTNLEEGLAIYGDVG